MGEYLSENRVVFSISEKVEFENMYRDYISELSLYSERLRSEPVTEAEINDIYFDDFLMKMFVLDGAGNKAGFCLLGFAKNTHPLTNYYIAEFYVAPAFRRMGVGTRAAKELLSLYPGKYCYHVLKPNNAARRFWENVIKECRCQVFALKDILNLEDCDFYAFKTFIKE